jgi:hypothetical protein
MANAVPNDISQFNVLVIKRLGIQVKKLSLSK